VVEHGLAIDRRRRRSGKSLIGMRRRLPRWATVAVWTTGVLGAHALLPVTLAGRSHRTGAQPRSAASLAGVGCLLAGTVGLVWSLAQHFEAAPERGYEVITLAPEYLLRAGPYRFNRNSM
jgi:hypothetical protein